MRYYLFGFIMMRSLSNAYVGCYSKGCTWVKGEKNKHGAILISNGKKYQWTGDVGVNIHPIEIKNVKKLKKVTLFLGKSCDAYFKLYGKGAWSLGQMVGL